MMDHTDRVALFVIEQKAAVAAQHPQLSEDHIKDEVMMRLAREVLAGRSSPLQAERQRAREELEARAEASLWREHDARMAAEEAKRRGKSFLAERDPLARCRRCGARHIEHDLARIGFTCPDDRRFTFVSTGTPSAEDRL